MLGDSETGFIGYSLKWNNGSDMRAKREIKVGNVFQMISFWNSPQKQSMGTHDLGRIFVTPLACMPASLAISDLHITPTDSRVQYYCMTLRPNCRSLLIT